MRELVLVLDTSMDRCSVAVGGAAGCVFKSSLHSPREHSELLHQTIAAALRELGWPALAAGGRLSCIGVTTGPGSFTGLRIGIAAAKGLAHAWQIPLIGIPTLDVLAEGLRRDVAGASGDERRSPVLAVGIPTRSGHCFAAVYDRDTGTQVGEIVTAMPLEALAAIRSATTTMQGKPGPIAFAGSPWRALTEHLADGETVAGPAADWPDPGILAAMVAVRFAMGGGRPPAEVAPVYIHRPGSAEPAGGIPS